METPDDYLQELLTLAETHPQYRRLADAVSGMLQRERPSTDGVLEAVFDGIDHVILVIDSENRTITRANEAVRSMLGYAPEETFGRSTRFLHVDQRHFEEFGRRSAAVLDAGRTYEVEYPLRRRDGSVFTAEITVKTVRISAGERPAVVSIIHDLSRRKREEQTLLDNSRKLATMFDSALDAIVFMNDDARYIDVNPAALKLMGCSRQEALAIGPADLMSATDARSFSQRWDAFRDAGWSTGETVLHTRDGRVVTVEYHSVADVLPGVHISINRDISDRKHHERGLERALQEREVLIREVHHRVKNNLQLISSMLNLQSTRVQGPAEARMLDAARHRIGTISLLYEHLLRNEYVADVQMDDYLHTLIGFLAGLSPEATIDRDVDAVILDIDRAIPCGLLVNELVANAIEHAFTGRVRGHVTVILKQVSDGSEASGEARSLMDSSLSAEYTAQSTESNEPAPQLELAVYDDGIGIAGEVDTENPGTLGLQLVRALASQLGGRLKIETEDGTRVRVRFPLRR